MSEFDSIKDLYNIVTEKSHAFVNTQDDDDLNIYNNDNVEHNCNESRIR